MREIISHVMKVFLLSTLAVFGLLGCRSATSGSSFVVSEETRALRKAQREANEQWKKDTKEDWKKHELERSENAKRFTQTPPDLKLLRERAAATDPIAEVSGSRIYKLDDRIYAQQLVDGKVESEVVANSWKQDNDELVFWGDAAAQSGNVSYGTDSENSEIRFLPNGKFEVIGKAERDRKGRSRMTMPTGSPTSNDPSPGFLPKNP